MILREFEEGVFLLYENTQRSFAKLDVVSKDFKYIYINTLQEKEI